MAHYTSEIGGGLDDGKMNSRFQSLLSNNKKSINSDGEDVKDIPHGKPASGQKYEGPMKGGLMTWTQMLESMDDLKDGIDDQIKAEENDITNEPISSDDPVAPSGGEIDEQELLNKLNEIFTPILVMQGLEGKVADKIQEAFSEASVLMERNIIQFDDASRMAQLISVCALLINQQRNTEKYQMYKKAAEIRNKMKLEMQKDVYDEAKTLAQKYLVKVSTTNNSSFARDAADDLLPQTQH